MTGTVTIAPPGAQLLDEMRDYLLRFSPLPASAAAAITLWCAHTHATGPDSRLVFFATPRLAVISNRPQSGKSTVLELCENLCARGLMIARSTAPAMAAQITQHRSTILFDEIDKLFSATGNGHADLQSMFNSGYKRSGKSLLTSGVIYSFAPLGLAGNEANFLGNPHLEALRTRAIVVRMEPATPGEVFEEDEDANAETGRQIAAAVGNWVLRNIGAIKDAQPEMPDDVERRMAQIWHPLLAVAEAAGGHWPQTAHTACLELSMARGSADEVLSPRQMMLRDVARVISAGEETLSSEVLAQRMFALEDAPWQSSWSNLRQAQRALADALRSAGVEPSNVRDGSAVLKSYRCADLLGAVTAVAETVAERVAAPVAQDADAA